jgi:hypothetical protein
MERERFLEPVAQVTEHAVKAVQEVTLQSMGQAKVLQVFTLEVLGQATPPWAAAFTTERERFLVPVAQVAEQAPKADHPETLQSMGQAKVLQATDMLKDGQAAPPYTAVLMVERVLVFWPVPQVAEQEE